MRVELHPDARAELRAAAIWYDERRAGLGDELIAEVSSTLDRIGDGPASFPVWPGTSGTPLSIRRAVVNRLPYVIAFEVHATHALVLAIAHAKRRHGRHRGRRLPGTTQSSPLWRTGTRSFRWKRPTRQAHIDAKPGLR